MRSRHCRRSEPHIATGFFREGEVSDESKPGELPIGESPFLPTSDGKGISDNINICFIMGISS